MTRSTRISIVGFAFVLALASSAAQAQSTLPRVRVEGNHFVDPNGRTMMFRGVSISDPDKLVKDGHWNRAYLEAVKSWNANVVRIPIHPRAWRERGPENYLKLLDDAVAWASELGLYVIIDWHSIGNLRTELFQNPMYITTRGETFQFWKAISERYKGNPAVAFYELFNEPTSYNGTLGQASWEWHKALMEDLIFMIYAIDNTKIPLVAGFDWAYELSGVREAPINYPGVAYVTHPYPQKRSTPWEDKWEEDFGFAANKYPVMATEIGFMSADGRGAHVPVIADETYGNAIVNYFEKKGISWIPWVFDPQWSPQLIDDWQFTPTQQGRFFKEKFEQLNTP